MNFKEFLFHFNLPRKPGFPANRIRSASQRDRGDTTGHHQDRIRLQVQGIMGIIVKAQVTDEC